MARAGRVAAARPARDLRLLGVGVGVSTAGDALALVALLLRLRPEGTGWVAALLAAQLIPMVVLAPVVGHLVDRIETRRVLLVAVAGQAVVAIPLALVSGPAPTVLLFLILGMFNAAVRPATNALIPSIVGEERSAHGYAGVALGQNIGFIVGPAAGGALTGAFGSQTALLVDATTLVALAAACLLLRVRRVPQSGEEDHALSRREEARVGFRVLWEDRVLRVVLTISAISLACAIVDNVAAPFRFIDQLGTTPTGYGVYLTLWGVGALLGSQLPARLPVAHQRYVPVVGNVVCGLGIAGIGAAPTIAVAFVASALGGIGNGAANVSQNTLIGQRVPEQLRGRAFAANSAVMQTAMGIGTASAGPLVATLDADVAMLTCGLLGAVAAALGTFALRR